MGKLLGIIIIVVVLVAFIAVASMNIDVSEEEGRKSLAKALWESTKKITSNVVKTIGYAIKLNWSPEIPENESSEINQTNQTSQLNSLGN